METLPKPEETHCIAIAHPVLDYIAGIFSSAILGDISQRDEISLNTAITHFNLDSICADINCSCHFNPFSQI